MENQKTVEEWFNELEEPYRSQAFKNTDKNLYGLVENSLVDALYAAFIFSQTIEGFKYWFDKTIQIKKEGK